MSGAPAEKRTSPEDDAVAAVEAAEAEAAGSSAENSNEQGDAEAEEQDDEAEQQESPNERVSTSAGAAGHHEGVCKPCAWNWKAAGCSKGKDCDFCHLCEEDSFKQRRREKVARLRSEEKAARRSQKAMALPGENDVMPVQQKQEA